MSRLIVIPICLCRRPFHAGAAEHGEGWLNLYDLVAQPLQGVLDVARDAGIDAPVAGYELMVGNRIVAEAELAWEGERIAIAYPAHIAALQKDNWTVFDCQSLIDDPGLLLKAFKIIKKEKII